MCVPVNIEILSAKQTYFDLSAVETKYLNIQIFIYIYIIYNNGPVSASLFAECKYEELD